MGVSLSVLQNYNNYFKSPNPIKQLIIKYLMIWRDFFLIFADYPYLCVDKYDFYVKNKSIDSTYE